MKIIFGAIFSLCVSLVYSQNLQDDINSIFNKIEQSQNVHLKTTISIYSNARKASKVMSLEAELFLFGDNYRNRIDQAEVIVNDKMMITIDKEEKIIHIAKKPKLSKKDLEFYKEIERLNNLSKDSSSVMLIDGSSSNRTYQITSSGDIETVLITLDLNEFKIKKIAYSYNQENFPDNNYVEIIYNDFTFDSTKSTDEKYKATDIFSQSGKKFIPTSKYFDYELIDLYHE